MERPGTKPKKLKKEKLTTIFLFFTHYKKISFAWSGLGHLYKIFFSRPLKNFICQDQVEIFL